VLLPMLQQSGFSVDRIDASDNHQCTHPCPSYITGINSSCASYSMALREQTKKSASSDFAISFHIDFTKQERKNGGGIVLCNSSLSSSWSNAFLYALEAKTGIMRRGKLGGWNGIFNLADPRAMVLFGKKYFLSHGAPHAVLVEVGVVNCKNDYKWLESDHAALDVADAAMQAAKEIHGHQ